MKTTSSATNGTRVFVTARCVSIIRSIGLARSGADASGKAGVRGPSGATYDLFAKLNPGSHFAPPSTHAVIVAISFSDRAGPFDGIRSSLSRDVIRLTSSLSLLLPGTTTPFEAIRVSSVLSDRSPLRALPVWHSPHLVLRIGTTSWAKSTLGRSADRQ